MKLIVFTVLLFILSLYPLNAVSSCNHGKKLRVAIVDTGLDLQDPRFKKHLCKTGHKNFVTDEAINDIDDHGTFIAGLITQYANNSNYCLLIYKFYQKEVSGEFNLQREVSSIKEAIRNKADIINLSEGGPNFSEIEFLIIRDNPKITFVVSAGNEGQNLDIPGNEYYPASYFLPNEKIVSSMGFNGLKNDFSNFSVKSEWEIGENISSTIPNNKTDHKSGTSMATAIFSGKLVDKLSRTCEYK